MLRRPKQFLCYFPVFSQLWSHCSPFFNVSRLQICLATKACAPWGTVRQSVSTICLISWGETLGSRGYCSCFKRAASFPPSGSRTRSHLTPVGSGRKMTELSSSYQEASSSAPGHYTYWRNWDECCFVFGVLCIGLHASTQPGRLGCTPS